MNRRGFFGTIGKVAAGFMILPGAGRVWKAVVDSRSINPDRVNAEFKMDFTHYAGSWTALVCEQRVVNGVVETRWEPYVCTLDNPHGGRMEQLFAEHPAYDEKELGLIRSGHWPANVNFPLSGI